MNSFFRTDLAAELIEKGNELPSGVERTEEITDSGILVERIKISERGSRAIGKPAGKYFTVNCGNLSELDFLSREHLISLLAKLLKELIFCAVGKKEDNKTDILIVGLGNEKMTPDAIGPKTVSLINMTRTLLTMDSELFYKLGCCSVSGFTPGAMGQTGIETSELVSGAVKASGCDAVIAIDALAALSADRLGSAIQLSDSGIHPGSGVGNRRKGLNKDNLGVPVISIGIPTVVDSGTLIMDFLRRSFDGADLGEVKRELEKRQNCFVSPKDCDALVECASRVFSSAVNLGFGIKNEM